MPVSGSLASMARRRDSSAAAAMRSAARRVLSSRQTMKVPAVAARLAVAIEVREGGIVRGGGKKRGNPNDGHAKRPARGEPERGVSMRCRRWPTLPRSLDRSTIGAVGLNDRVRDGNGCGPYALIASENLPRTD